MAFPIPRAQPTPAPTGDRSQDLENLLGNYLITDFQRTKLQDRIVDFVFSNYSRNKNKSSHMFKHKDNWYELRVEVNKISDKEEPVTEPVESDEASTHFP